MSVKSPERRTSVINHFNPAGHVYAASGRVVIDQGTTGDSPKHNIIQTQRVVEPPRSVFIKPVTSEVRRTVSVKTPPRQTSVISHFDPGRHVFDSSGNVEIRKTTTTQKRFGTPSKVRVIKTEIQNPPVQVVRNIFKKPPSSLNLERTVSVKSPQRVSNVINHFTPAGHNYAATGHVKIQQGHSGAAQIRKPTSGSVAVKTETIRNIIRNEPPVQIVKTIAKEPEVLNVQRVVSVKSPQRASSVNHFNPAGHIYESTGNVKIQRTGSISTNSNLGFQPIPVRFSPQKKVVRTETVHSIQNIKKPVVTKPLTTSLNLERTVSVKSPQRVSNVINHFTPAGHNYAATGHVKIQQETSANRFTSTATKTQARPTFVATEHKFESVKTRKPTKIQAVVQKPSVVQVQKTTEVKRSAQSNQNNLGFTCIAAPNFQASTPEKTKIKKTTVETHIEKEVEEEEQEQKLIATFVKPASSVLEVERTVSVKSPQRVSSVISHFTPAGHRYAATGNVKIHKESTASSFNTPVKTSFKVPSQPIRTVIREQQKVVKRPIELVQIEEVRTIEDPRPPAIQRVEVVETEIRRQPPAQIVQTIQHKPSVKVSSSAIDVERTVSVKSPERVSSVISHFTPAGHRYAATGNVKIHKESTSPSFNAPIKTTFKAPPRPLQFVKPIKTVFREQQKVVERPIKVIQVEEKRTIEETRAPAVKPSVVKVSSSDLDVERTVSVKSPERVSSVISHFTPAGHRYAATGKVKIHSTSSSNTPTVFVPKKETEVIEHPEVTLKDEEELQEPEIAFVEPVPDPAPVAFETVVAKLSPIPHIDSSEELDSFEEPEIVVHREEEKEDQPYVFETSQGYVYNEPAISSYLPPLRGPGSNIPSFLQPLLLSLPDPSPTQTIRVEEDPKPVAPKPELPKPAEIKPVANNFELKKVVSVNLPERRISPIDHFNPAGHKYKATGSVTINQSS